MFISIPPPPPERPRSSFKSESEYQIYQQARRDAEKEHQETRRTHEAMMILFAALALILVAGMLGHMVFMLFGWRGFIWAASVIGLCWVAFIQIRRRIS